MVYKDRRIAVAMIEVWKHSRKLIGKRYD